MVVAKPATDVRPPNNTKRYFDMRWNNSYCFEGSGDDAEEDQSIELRGSKSVAGSLLSWQCFGFHARFRPSDGR